MNNILLAFDFGTKSIGVAIGQRIVGIAYPLNALRARNGIPNWNAIKHLIKEWKPEEIIIGLPLNIDGTEQPITTYSRKFAKEIHKRFFIETKLHDERLSTCEARTRLFEYYGFRILHKKHIVDSISAAIILESYFNQIF